MFWRFIDILQPLWLSIIIITLLLDNTNITNVQEINISKFLVKRYHADI